MENKELTHYQPFLKEIILKIQLARYEMLKTVSKQTVALYWEIGKAVSEKVKSEKWGKSVVEQLSKDLQTEHPGIRGFSARNIWRMKTFYEVYNENEFLPPLVAEIGWVQNCLIIEKCKDDVQREYYLRKTKQMGWSKADLIDKLKRNHFENQALAQNNLELTVSPEIKAKIAFRSSYGYEWQGDSLLIARENLLYTFIDYYQDKFKETPSTALQKEMAEIIVWNIFQMDGLKYVIPMSCKTEKKVKTQLSFFPDEIEEEKPCTGCENKAAKNHNGIYVNIMDWKEDKINRFVDILD